MWLVDVLIVWGRVLPLSYQWLSALFDGLLAIGAGLMTWNLRPMHYSDLPRFTQRVLWGSRKFHVLLFLVWLALSMLHVYQERGSVDTWERRLGPNSIYHNLFLFPFLGYVYSLLLFATASLMFGYAGIHGSVLWFFRGWFVFLLSFGIAAGWFWAGAQFDVHHQRAPNGVSKHNYSSPYKPWCGGVITVHICGPVRR